MAYNNVIYSLPLYDCKKVNQHERETSFLNKYGYEILANVEEYKHITLDLENMYIKMPTYDMGIERNANALFKQWCKQYQKKMWRPIDFIKKITLGTYEYEVEAPNQDKYCPLRNLGIMNSTLDVSTKVFALPPHFGVTRKDNHTFKIKGRECDTYVQPMIISEADYSDLKNDLLMCTMYKEFNVKTYGRSFLKNYLKREDFLDLTNELSNLDYLGIVRGPVTIRGNRHLMGRIGDDSKIKPCEKFLIEFDDHRF